MNVSSVLEKNPGAGNLKNEGQKLFPCLAVARLSSLPLCFWRGSRKHQCLPCAISAGITVARVWTLQWLCFSAAFYYEQKNRVAVHYLSFTSMFISFTWSLLLLMSHKHLGQSQCTVGNLFSSVIDQRLEWTFPEILLPTPVPSTASLLSNLSAIL